jgi:hypothetical protein
MFEDPEYANKHITRLLRGHPEKLRIESGLTIYQFESLATWLRENTNLEASRHASVEAKLGIFLYICGQGVSYRGASIHWEFSISQVSVFFHQVLRALLELAKHNIKMFPTDEAVPVPAQNL